MLRVLPLLCFFGSAAGADLTDDLETCARLADAESRLACFDAIGRKVVAPTDTGGEVEEPVAPTESMAPAAEPPEPAASLDTVETSGLDAVTENEREAIEREATADAVIAEKERTALEEAEKAAEEEREQEPIFRATIVRVIRHNDRRFSVVLDNDQVWRETQGSRVRTPREGAAVELMRGRFGGYRMKIDGVPRIAWVNRTK